MFCYRVYVKGYFFIHVPDFQCGCLQNNTVVFGDNAYYNGISLFSFDDENEFIEEMNNA